MGQTKPIGRSGWRAWPALRDGGETPDTEKCQTNPILGIGDWGLGIRGGGYAGWRGKEGQTKPICPGLAGARGGTADLLIYPFTHLLFYLSAECADDEWSGASNEPNLRTRLGAAMAETATGGPAADAKRVDRATMGGFGGGCGRARRRSDRRAARPGDFPA